jgi:hypothetical protein
MRAYRPRQLYEVALSSSLQLTTLMPGLRTLAQSHNVVSGSTRPRQTRVHPQNLGAMIGQ